MKAGQWLELTMPDRNMVLVQIAERQEATGRPITFSEVAALVKETEARQWLDEVLTDMKKATCWHR